jgi:uncharacterized membrane protein
MIEGIIEISIYSYFNYRSSNFNTIGEILGINQSYFSLGLIVVIMPLINIYLLIQAYRDINNLDNDLIKFFFKVFYENFDKKRI